jgi:hypothetical protein
MVAAGLQVEAHTINEQMFADWLENNIQQIEAALEISSIKDAMWHLSECRQALRICGTDSPIMRVFHHVLKLLEYQVNEMAALQAGIIRQSTIKPRLRTQVQTTSSLQIRKVQRRSTIDLSPSDTDTDLVQRLTEGESILELLRTDI